MILALSVTARPNPQIAYLSKTGEKGDSMRRFFRSAACAAAALALSLAVSTSFAPLAVAETPAPGGWIEAATSLSVRTKAAISLPERGQFTFPAPYKTTGVRLTTGADCGGQDCVNDVGYSYWRNSNNHVGDNEMLIVITLDRGRGGAGPTLYSYDKKKDTVKVVGPLFGAEHPLSWATGEGWYWSGTRPNALYVNDMQKLYRYDVKAKTLETVFDVADQAGGGRYLWQIHSSADDTVHSATLRDSDSYAMLGCLVYRETTKASSFYPARGEFDECQIDKSGRWLLIKDNVDGSAGEDNRIVDVQTGHETLLLDQDGAAGHSDNGYGYMVAEDNWNALPGAVRVWTFADALPGTAPQGRVVYRTADWALNVGHISHANAQPTSVVPLTKQYACGAQGTRVKGPRANEIVCFKLDGTFQVLVVAPTMTDLDAVGGGATDYTKLPKGNLDVTGQYFIWTANAGTRRLDAFVVRIPSQLLTGVNDVAPPPPPPPDTRAPTVAITAPASGAVIHGTVTVGVRATDDVGVAGVQYKVNGVKVGDEVTTPPFSFTWDTLTSGDGHYTIKAIARDAAGHTTTSAGLPVTVKNNRATVTWTNLVNARAAGAALAKTGGCDGCPDAGAVSSQTLRTVGYAEFRASETSSLRVVGLDKKEDSATAAPVKFAIVLQPGGIAEVREKGQYRAETPFSSGDTFRISVSGGVVRYTKNGAPIYESALPPGGTMRVRASLYSTSATITDAVVSGSP